MATTQYLNTPQAAELLNISPSTLERFRVTGDGPPFHRWSRKAIRYRPEDLEAWAAARRCNSTSEY